MRKCTFIILMLFCLGTIGHAKERSFPPQVLSARTLAVVAHYGLTPATSDLATEAKMKGKAEKVLEKWGRYQLVQDPDKADIVLLVFAGFGYGDVAAAAVFPGGNQTWNPMPLWIGEEISTLLNFSPVDAVARRFQKDVDEQENKATSSDKEAEKPASNDKAQEATSEVAPPHEEQSANFLPPEILQAKTAASVWRFERDRIPEKKGESADKPVVKELQKWGRYAVVDEPSKADLIVLTVRLSPGGRFFGGRAHELYNSVFIFKGGGRPRWSDMPLWAYMQEAVPWSGSDQLIKRLRNQVEASEISAPK